jgi:hypothetical protein
VKIGVPLTEPGSATASFKKMSPIEHMVGLGALDKGQVGGGSHVTKRFVEFEGFLATYQIHETIEAKLHNPHLL